MAAIYSESRLNAEELEHLEERLGRCRKDIDPKDKVCNSFE